MPKYDLEHNFNTLDNQSSYWLGFIWADGELSINNTNSKRLRLALSNKDLNHLEKFRDWISPEKPLYSRSSNNSSSFEISDKTLYDNLYNYGIYKHRSKTVLKCFPLVPKNYLNHFIRGVFDGDGTFGIYQQLDKRVNIIYTITQCKITTQCKEFAETLCNILNKNNINFYIVTEKRRPVYHIQSNNKSELVKFINWLYQDSTEETRMIRKYDKANEIMELYSHR